MIFKCAFDKKSLPRVRVNQLFTQHFTVDVSETDDLKKKFQTKNLEKFMFFLFSALCVFSNFVYLPRYLRKMKFLVHPHPFFRNPGDSGKLF